MKKTTATADTSQATKGKQKTRVVKFGPKASRLRARIIKVVREVVAERESRQAS